MGEYVVARPYKPAFSLPKFSPNRFLRATFLEFLSSHPHVALLHSGRAGKIPAYSPRINAVLWLLKVSLKLKMLVIYLIN